MKVRRAGSGFKLFCAFLWFLFRLTFAGVAAYRGCMLKEQIEKWCVENGKTRGDLAHMLNVGQSQVSKWASRSCTPRVDTNYQLAELLGLDPLVLWQWFKAK